MNNCHICGCEVTDIENGFIYNQLGQSIWQHYQAITCIRFQKMQIEGCNERIAELESRIDAFEKRCLEAEEEKIATLEKLMIKTLVVLARGDINDVDISWAKEQINAKL